MKITIGKAVKKLRIEKGLTQKSLENKTGIPREYISKWENGHLDNPTYSMIKSVANGFGIRASELVAMMEGEG